MQVIYQGKTTANQPRAFKFPRGLEISQNLLKMKLLTLRDKVSVHYVERKRKKFKLAPTQKAPLIWDVFRGQNPAKVLTKLASLNIAIVSVPAKMNHLFQPLTSPSMWRPRGL